MDTLSGVTDSAYEHCLPLQHITMFWAQYHRDNIARDEFRLVVDESLNYCTMQASTTF
jgi:hypothetical protein